MHPVTLIAQALDAPPALPSVPIDGVCAVTGLQGPSLARRELFGKSFTDGGLLAAPASERVGVDAFVAIKHKWERMSSWRCDGRSFERLDRVGVRNAVLGPQPTRPWCAYATTSYKKHGALRAPVNSGGPGRWLFENRVVDCGDMAQVSGWWERLNGALRAGFSRPILETLECPGYVMRKAGLSDWMEFQRWARPRHQSALYAFLCYLLPSQAELRDEPG